MDEMYKWNGSGTPSEKVMEGQGMLGHVLGHVMGHVMGHESADRSCNVLEEGYWLGFTPIGDSL